MPLNHGGQLNQVAAGSAIPQDDWLDLSTGISPFAYSVANIPAKYWQALPHVPDSLIEIAKHYYQAKNCIACAGSQSIIEKLPELWKRHCGWAKLKSKRVYLPLVGYKEHELAWQQAGFEICYYQSSLPAVIAPFAVVVVVNPNNPSGQIYQQNELLELQEKVKLADGLLVIDEAFMDVIQPSQSMAQYCDEANTLILKSFGKFFGLAGLRIGFVCGSDFWLSQLKRNLSPWSVNGPALYIAEQALADSSWQQMQKERLAEQVEQMLPFLETSFQPVKISYTSLFITLYLNQAEQVYQKLCKLGIYVRLTDEKDALRFGIADKKALAILKIRLSDS